MGTGNTDMFTHTLFIFFLGGGCKKKQQGYYTKSYKICHEIEEIKYKAMGLVDGLMKERLNEIQCDFNIIICRPLGKGFEPVSYSLLTIQKQLYKKYFKTSG